MSFIARFAFLVYLTKINSKYPGIAGTFASGEIQQSLNTPHFRSFRRKTSKIDVLRRKLRFTSKIHALREKRRKTCLFDAKR